MIIPFSIDPLKQLSAYVIDKYSEIKGLCQTTGMYADVPTCVSCHSQSYYGGTLKYQCENFKRVYLLRFLVSHTKQTCDLIEETIISDIAKSADLSSVSFGGGPGVEAFALMEQLSKRDGAYNLLFDNIDRESSWKPIYLDLVQAFSSWITKVKINPRFSQLDVTSKFSATTYDIVFVPWIISEMEDEVAQTVLTKARDLARPGRYVVITDRPESDLVGRVSAIVEKIQGWSLINGKAECVSYCGVQFPDEIRDAFWVQLKYSTAYWVLQKG